MSEPFLAEIRMFGFNFAPRGWAFCDGQVLPINQNQSLYSLLGTTYGGDGRTSFALPELRGRVPIHVATGHPLGQKGGAETHTLTADELPAHSHTLPASGSQATQSVPAGDNVLAGQARRNPPLYGSPPPAGSETLVNPDTIGQARTPGNNPFSGQAHQNMQPFIAVNYAIALSGVFPSRN